jgi:hypothetical protein
MLDVLTILDGTPFSLADEDMATESALYDAEAPRFDEQVHLYKVYGLPSKDIRLILVEPKIASLESKHVFLLDYGLELFTWCGSKSTLNHAMKLKMLVQRLNNSERIGRAVVEEERQGQESASFITLLHGEDETGADFDNVVESKWTTIMEKAPLLYRFISF